MIPLYQKLLAALATLLATLSGPHLPPHTILAGGTLPSQAQIAQDAAINPYTPKGAILEKTTMSTLPEAGAETVDIDTTQPKLTLKKWNGEVAMGVTYQGLHAKGGRPFMSKNVEWSDTNEKMQVVPLAASSTFEDGGYEINVVINSKPTSNVFNFSIDNAQNLDFFYQAPLWQEAGMKAPTKDCTDTLCNIRGEGTSTRPDNVVGSYAVYYKAHANHVQGKTNYATGKAYHIFRPLVTDATGATTWADLSYSNGILTVTVPQSFLDGAVYPMTVDPTFGYTTHGGSNLSIPTSATLTSSIVGSYVASSGDTITNFSMWGFYGQFFSGPKANFAAFSVVGGVVTNQLATGVVLAINSNVDQLWTSSNFSQSPIAGTGYGVAFSGESNATASDWYQIDFDAGTNPGRFNSTRTVFPGAGNGFSPTGTDSGRHYSVYATYTAGAPAASTGETYIVRFQ